MPARGETFPAGHIESPPCKEHRQYNRRRRRQQEQVMGASLGAREVGRHKIPQGGKPPSKLRARLTMARLEYSPPIGTLQGDQWLREQAWKHYPLSLPWTRPTAMDFHATGRMAPRWLAGKMPAAPLDQGRQTSRLLNASQPSHARQTTHPWRAVINTKAICVCARVRV